MLACCQTYVFVAPNFTWPHVRDEKVARPEKSVHVCTTVLHATVLLRPDNQDLQPAPRCPAPRCYSRVRQGPATAWTSTTLCAQSTKTAFQKKSSPHRSVEHPLLVEPPSGLGIERLHRSRYGIVYFRPCPLLYA